MRRYQTDENELKSAEERREEPGAPSSSNPGPKPRMGIEPLTFGHLGLMSRALMASSRAVLYWPSLRYAAERLLYRMQFCGSAPRASEYRRTARAKSPFWQAWLLRRTRSRNSALLRAAAPEPDPGTDRVPTGDGGFRGQEEGAEGGWTVLFVERDPKKEN